MSFFGDVFSFEGNKLENALGKYKKDPERMFLGINTPFESKVWGGVTGKEYTPTVDMYGGATQDDSETAKARGINTGPGEGMHTLARTIANYYGMKKLNGMTNGYAGKADAVANSGNNQGGGGGMGGGMGDGMGMMGGLFGMGQQQQKPQFDTDAWIAKQKEDQQKMLLAQNLQEYNPYG